MTEQAAAGHRPAVTHHDSYRELPKELLDWQGYYGGFGPLDHAERYPDEWHEAFMLTPAEGLLLAFGFDLGVLHIRPWAVRYDSATRLYLAYPLRLMPRNAGLPTMPHPWSHLYRPLIIGAVRPFIGFMRCAGGWMADASDILGQVIGGIMDMIRCLAGGKEDASERPQVRTT